MRQSALIFAPKRLTIIGAALAVIAAIAVVAVVRLAGGGSTVRAQVTETGGGSVVLGGAKLSVAPGQVRGDGQLVASTGSGQPPARGMSPAGPAGAIAAAPAPVHFEITGSQVTEPMTISFRLKPGSVPASLPARAVSAAAWLAYYDPAAGQWHPVASTFDPATQTVTARVTHLSWWMPWTWDWQGTILRLRQALSGFGSGRAPASTCPAVSEVSITSAGQPDPPLIGCAASAGADRLTVTLTSNRGLSMVMVNIPADATLENASYTGFAAFLQTRRQADDVAGGTVIPATDSLTYSLPLDGPPVTFTAETTLRSYALDLALAIGDAVTGQTTYQGIEGGYLTCVLNAVARSAPASMSDAAGLASGCLPEMLKAMPDYRRLAAAIPEKASAVLTLLAFDINRIIQYFDLLHDAILAVPAQVRISRPQPAATATAELYLSTAFTSGFYTYPNFPRSIGIDNHDWIDHLSWSVTGQDTITGTGTLNYDECNPDCASGPMTTYQVEVTASQPRSCAVGGSPRYIYSKIDITPVNSQPPAAYLGSTVLSPQC